MHLHGVLPLVSEIDVTRGSVHHENDHSDYQTL